MKIFASEENLLTPLGGGELSFETLISGLSINNEVLTVGKHVKNPHAVPFPSSSIPLFETNTYMLNKYFVFKQLERSLSRKMRNFSPDLVITQQDFAAPTIKIAYEEKIPSIVFMRNYEHICLCANPESNCNRNCSVCYGYSSLNPYRYFVNAVFRYEKEWIPRASLILSNSHYMASVVKDWFGVESHVIYPFVREISVREQNPEYITLINASKHKGIETFLEIVRKLPEKKFLVVGHNPEYIDFSKYPNITYMPWADHPETFYSKTKILLVPSLWPEPFGRVCVEAAFCGIPSIASQIGGLPEAVGEGGILIENYGDPEKWIDAISLLEDENKYREYSEKAEFHALKFKIETNIRELKNLVKTRLELVI
ncbi:glycosyltransferase [Methanosarcina sp. KYL-1]|uniref:glycosyltransferase n=1 Tax=Methanosarcina sp. KYL-1 TaxID=2602068 RepID=UPI0021014266|nr:glycosyltransferase [Methanosarcina sp. KYL-1]MCQ1536899.1 glycosyltransferase [Methanosarcina sp. KYL-1]